MPVGLFVVAACRDPGPATLEPPPTEVEGGALASGALDWRVWQIAENGYFVHRLALRKIAATGLKNPACALQLVEVTGYDHQPQHLLLRRFEETRGPCRPSASTLTVPLDARYWSAAVAGDFDGDGLDELAAAAFADASGSRRSGEIVVARGSDVDLEHPIAIDLPYAVASLAIGDVTGDGTPDLVVGTLGTRAGPLPPPTRVGTRAITTTKRPDLNGPVQVYDGVGIRAALDAHLPFADLPVATLPCAQGALALALGDVDGDGALDVISAGPIMTVSFGPLGGDAAPRGLVLPWSRRARAGASGDDTGCAVGQRDAEGKPLPVAHALDVLYRADASGTRETLVVAAESCFNSGECGAVMRDFAVDVWRIAAGAASEVRVESVPLDVGIVSVARFADVDVDGAADLLLGRMTSPRAGPAGCGDGGIASEAIGCMGAGPMWLRGDAAGDAGPWGVLPVELPLRGATTTTAEVRFMPMTTAIVPVGASRPSVEVETRHAPARVLSYLGQGEVMAVSVRMGSELGPEVPAAHRVGERWASLRGPLPQFPLFATWKVVLRPDFLIASSNPIPGASNGVFYVATPTSE